VKSRRVSIVLLAALAAVAASTAAAPSAFAADKLPDLAMEPLTDIYVQKTSDGRRLLRFTTVIVNIGSGPFEVRGTRATNESEMSTIQRIYDSPSDSRDVETPAVMFFAGDDHFHWHVRDLETSELIRLDNGAKVGTGEKRGFCFFDNEPHDLTLAGAPQDPIYRGCGSSSSTAVTMGLSVGWGDKYPATLKFQYIDITGLTAGRYNLVTVADQPNWFVESDDTNNGTAVEVQITGNSTIAVTEFPISTTIKNGTRRTGDVSRLAADDDSFFEVNSASGTTFWYGNFAGISNRLTNLRVHYSGKNSLTSSQRIRLWNYRTGKWNTVDTRSVGPSEVSLTALPGGTLADYVSGSRGDGDLRVGVRTRRSDSTRYFSSADALSVVYDLP
jgi:hypothetical protein